MSEAAMSEQEARERKQSLLPQASVQQWASAGTFPDPQSAQNYLNLEPAQHAGEVSATVFPDGRVALFIYS